MLALIAGSALTPVASAQEIMLERVGAVRLAAPGELERNEEWLQKAFHNQARIEAPQAIRVSSSRARMKRRSRRADARPWDCGDRVAWSGRRKSNPRMKLGKLPFCH